MIKALESYTKPFRDRCVPPGAVNWQDSDNNVNFLNKITIMVPNPSLSIPASQKNPNPDNYFKNMVTFEWPDKPDGRPIEYVASIKTAVIFKNAQEQGGGQGVHALLPAAREPRARTSRARWRAGSRSTSGLIDTPYWKDASDPHKVVEVRQYTQRPQTRLAARPQPQDHRRSTPRTPGARRSPASCSRTGRPEQAVDELIARIKQVAGS